LLLPSFTVFLKNKNFSRMVEWPGSSAVRAAAS
jgi:hypothetical protein